MYLLHGEGVVARIRNHLADGDLASVGRTAHELSGMADNIGVMRVGELAALLEQACIDGHQEQATKLTIELYRAHAAVSAALRVWLVSQNPVRDVAGYGGLGRE